MTTISDVVQFLSVEAAATSLSQQPSTTPQPFISQAISNDIYLSPIETTDEESVKLKKIKALPKFIKPTTRTEQHNFLQGYEFIVMIDRDLREKSWIKLKEYFPYVIQAAFKYDPKGVEVGVYFDRCVAWYSNIKPEMTSKFLSMITPSPAGSASLDFAIQRACMTHFRKKHINENQKTIILVLTGKTPINMKAVNNQLIHYANKIHTADIGIYEGSRKCFELGIRFFRLSDNPLLKAYFNELPARLEEGEIKVDLVSTGIYSELSSKAGAREAFVNTIYN